MADQPEEIRRRLEALRSGQPLPPKPEPEPEPAFMPAPAATLQPATAALARKRKLQAALEDPSHAQPVVVVDVRIKFWSLVILMVKTSIAAIPATLIIAAFWFVLIRLLWAWLGIKPL